MTLPGHIFTAPDGVQGFDTAASVTPEAAKLGVPWGVTIWCDLEGVKPGTPGQRVIDYCNRWHEAVSSAGYVPGVYVGYRAGLSPTQLYRSLRFTHYWGAYNLNADRYPAVRGLQMKQSRPRPSDSVPDSGIDFQIDEIMSDALGGRPTLLALEGWPE